MICKTPLNSVLIYCGSGGGGGGDTIKLLLLYEFCLNRMTKWQTTQYSTMPGRNALNDQYY